MAGGSGSRMGLGGDVVKPLRLVAGQPLIAYTLQSIRLAGIRSVAVALPEQDVDLSRWLAHQSWIEELVLLRLPTKGTLDAALQLELRMRSSDYVLSTADVICPPSTVADLLVVHSTRNSDMTVVATDLDIDDDPIWVNLVDGDRVVRIGKGEPGHAVFGNIRACRRGLLRRVAAKDQVSRDSELLGAVARFSKRVFSLSVPSVMDVDRPEELAIAEELVERDWPVYFPNHRDAVGPIGVGSRSQLGIESD
jgi:NDP-sugar pyrophosphorylase family protein